MVAPTHSDIRADNILLDVHGEIRITGLRQMLSLSEGGEHMESVFSLVGDNIEWAAPEVLAQVNEVIPRWTIGW